MVATTADINAGTVDAVLGGTTPAAATVLSLIASAAAAEVVSTTATSTTATALRAYATPASRTVPLVEIINDDPTGAGGALIIQQDQSGNGINIQHNFVGVSQPTIKANITDATNTGDVTCVTVLYEAITLTP